MVIYLSENSLTYKLFEGDYYMSVCIITHPTDSPSYRQQTHTLMLGPNPPSQDFIGSLGFILKDLKIKECVHLNHITKIVFRLSAQIL